MVPVLIRLRSTVTRHQVQRTSPVPLVLAGLLGLASAAGTLLLGFTRHARPGAGLDILAMVFALWLAGQVVQAGLTGGDAALRPEMLALLPLPRYRLALALLAVGLANPLLFLLTGAYAALIPIGVRSGPAATAVAVAATALTVVLTSVLSTISGGILGPGSRRGRDAGTIVVAVALSLLALSGTLLPSLISGLDDGTARWLSVLVRVLPSGWGADAVEAATRADWTQTTIALGGLVALLLAATAAWPTILQRRMSASPSAGPARRSQTGRRMLPATPVGAVTAKELRLWARDPVRLTCLLIAVVVGVGVGVIPEVTAGTTLLMPFAGPLTVIIAGACACNLYGSDGTSLWLTIMTPASSSPDIRGRQTAWLLVVAPFSVVETVLLTVLSGRADLWPWSIAALLTLLGGAAGLSPLASLISVQPFDDAGNPTPAWSLKIHVALVAVILTAVPSLALLTAGAYSHGQPLQWAAVPVAAVTGGLLRHGLGSAAARRLRTNQTAVLDTLNTAS